jgi:hypothetical protein
MRRSVLLSLGLVFLAGPAVVRAADGETGPGEKPLFTRHVQAVFSRLGCNGGTCHGAVKGQNGFRLSLFGGDPALDHERLLHESGGRRLNLLDPDASLLLLKATGQASHQGGSRMTRGSPEYQLVRRWITAGALLDPPERSRVTRLHVHPAEHTARPGETYPLRVEAAFADGSREDVTRLCSYESLAPAVATVSVEGQVNVRGVGDAALVIRFRAEPALATLVVPRSATETAADARPHNFIDRHILAKLRRLNIPSAELCDDATFLRRASLDVTGELPAPNEVRAFLDDTSPDKRERKIEELLHRPGHAALWTLKFCDLLKATDFGVYADGIRQEVDAPRFQNWVRARLEENVPYDQFVERILTATSRDGRDVDSWAKEVLQMEEGYAAGRPDVARYRRRRTLDLYWQRSSSTGVAATLQVAHAFLGLRLECAQCHRHPHDVWQQDDLLSFANFFMPVRKIGFQGDNEKKFPAVAAVFKRMNDESKALTEQVKKMRENEFKKLEAKARTARTEADRLGRETAKLEKDAEQATAVARAKRAESEKNAGQAEKLRKEADDLEAKSKQAVEKSKQLRPSLAMHQATLAEMEKMRKQLAEMEHRGRSISEAARRVMHSEVRLLQPGKDFATVTSPIGTQTSKRYRLLGQAEDITLAKDEDPRRVVMAWLRRPDNPYFAKAIVNRVWASYFGRGIIDPPDNLSSFNPPSHPELLQELSRAFIEHQYDLKWLHRTILRSRTYQQSSMAGKDNDADHANYAYFYYRRLPAEVLVDALNQATGTTEKMDMEYYFWPANLKTVEASYTPRNAFVAFMLANFGKPKRNSAVQCDCERDGDPSVLQVLSFANHPRVWAKITDDKGQVARIVKEFSDDNRRIEEVFLVSLSRLPRESEMRACRAYLQQASSPARGLQGILWSLLNTREFVLQH